ncbi:3-isopropylmalate dehydratase large subunit [Bordetella flabilis]|uniref:3-isopropylmalate dehydratase large subunit n=1 Tax=Bordetella flabilis TaxID=463014 RepID=A0A193GIK3_9BORD|nr:3-isopropylmalate dehydratase large subunit [Bordetella flabilis]ANN79670.1 3-isopropylmalate dehydratase large subunit [Bordetella flabilis]
MSSASAPRTLFDKIWSRHQVLQRDDGASLLYVDRHLVQDGSAPAFAMLRQRGLSVHSPQRSFATPDHYVPTDTRDLSTIADPEKRAMADALRQDAKEAGMQFFGLDDARQGIIHVVGPEQGLSLPGMLIVCGDSHTATHGAMGAFAFGIGASEVAHVLATQSVWQRKPPTMRVTVTGRLQAGVTAKDIILGVIAQIGAAGATGHVIEYAGPAITALSMEGRMTVCNMSIEAGARAGMIAPDETTFAWLHGRPYAPSGAAWDEALAQWRTLRTDDGATFDREVTLDAGALQPMVTWGNSPEDALPVSGRVPDPASASDAARQASMARTLEYMGLRPGMALTDIAVDRVFIGSCTNGRIEDLRQAAEVARGRRVAAGVQAWVVPGSQQVKLQAEQEGLDRVFREAGFEWRYAGCSMCLATNGDQVAPGQRCASTSNRNFVGRQGPGSRTHLMSPVMAAAAAVSGHLADPRPLLDRS